MTPSHGVGHYRDWPPWANWPLGSREINQPLSIVATWAEVALREIREKLGEDGKEAILSIDVSPALMEPPARSFAT